MLGRTYSGRRVRIVLAGVGVVVGPAAAGLDRAAADTFRWVNPAGGLFGEGSNWNLGGAPGAADDVIFDLDASYAIAGAANVRQVTMEAGEVQLNLTGTANFFEGWTIAGG